MKIIKIICLCLTLLFATITGAEESERISISIAKTGPFKQKEPLDLTSLKEEVVSLIAAGKSVKIVLGANFDQSKVVKETISRIRESPELAEIPIVQIFAG